MRGPEKAAQLQPQWTTKVRLGVVCDGSRSFHAEVFRGTRCFCHISLAGRSADEAAGNRRWPLRRNGSQPSRSESYGVLSDIWRASARILIIRLLAALERAGLRRWQLQLEPIVIPLGQVLYAPRAALTFRVA